MAGLVSKKSSTPVSNRGVEEIVVAGALKETIPERRRLEEGGSLKIFKRLAQWANSAWSLQNSMGRGTRGNNARKAKI